MLSCWLWQCMHTGTAEGCLGNTTAGGSSQSRGRTQISGPSGRCRLARLQAIAFDTSAVRALQAIWVAALAVALPVALHRRWLMIPHAHVEVLAGAAAIGSVIAELFMIKSLVVFDPKISTDVATNGPEPASPRYSRGRVSICLP